jgi:hypothetical protein
LFFRIKPSGPYRYLQLVENRREGYRSVQRVLLTLGRLDKLTATGSTDALLRSLARFGQTVRLMKAGDLEKSPSRQLAGARGQILSSGGCGRPQECRAHSTTLFKTGYSSSL